MKTQIFSLLILVASMSQAALQPYQKTMANGKTITFLKDASMTPEAFSKSPYNMKPDQALLQNNYPLKDAEKAAITADDIQKMTQEEIDQLYIRLDAGPIVPGSYNGKIVMNGEMVGDIRKRIYSKVVGEAPILGKVISKVCDGRDPVECFGEMAWKGKRIYPKNEAGEYLLRNAINEAVFISVHGAIAPAKESAGALWANVTDFFGATEDEAALKEMFPDPKSINPLNLKAMLFPAHVYCGQSLLDHRRESIIIDYAWGKDFKPFNKNVDVLTGPGYLDIRDEVRMVKPGLYVGRAYTNKIFLLNFVLTNEDKNVGAFASTCFDGKSTTR